MKRTLRLFGLMLSLLVCGPAWPQAAPVIQAHPSLWHVRGPKGDAWLFGSVHILPPNVNWRTDAVRAAMAQADVFVFEVPENAETKARVQELVKSRGFLPPGQHLRGMLPPDMQPKFDAALAASGVSPAEAENERPWLVGLRLIFAEMAKEHYGTEGGVDIAVMAQAQETHRPMRYFETIDQQFALLAPDDPKLELEEFESGLNDIDVTDNVMQPMVDAWAAGDQAALGKLINADMDDTPGARKAIIDDRNARWVPQLQAMLAERHHYFITVGAGHLTGPDGVPALLRKAGYRVEGP